MENHFSVTGLDGNGKTWYETDDWGRIAGNIRPDGST